MRAIVKERPERGARYVEDRDEPVVGPSDVLLQVHAVSVCGTDREIFEWTPSAEAFALDLPVVLGHEFAGTVLQVGDEVSRAKPGDRVAIETHIPCGECHACRTGEAHLCHTMRIVAMHSDGAFAERVAVPESVCFVMPEDMPLDTGALLEPAGVAWHALHRPGVPLQGATVAISGCGPIGLLLIPFAFALGAAEVIGIEPNHSRRETAQNLGATVFSPGPDAAAYIASALADAGGVDLAFEVSGVDAGLQAVFGLVRREGSVVTIGHPGAPASIDIARDINKRGITLRGVFGRRLWETWEGLAGFLSDTGTDISWIVSHRMPLGELEPVMDLLAGGANKILIYPGGVPDATSIRKD